MPLDDLTFDYGEAYTLRLFYGFDTKRGIYIGRLNRMFMFVGVKSDNTPELYFVGPGADRFISINKGSLELRESEIDYFKEMVKKYSPKLKKAA